DGASRPLAPYDEDHDVVRMLDGRTKVRCQRRADLVYGLVVQRPSGLAASCEPGLDVLAAPFHEAVRVEEQQVARLQVCRRLDGVESLAPVERLCRAVGEPPKRSVGCDEQRWRMPGR